MDALYATTAEQMKTLGLPADLCGTADVTVWEDAWPAIKLFSKRLSTQWRCGPGGLIGLDYTIAYAELDKMPLDDEERETFLDQLGIIERAAMEALQPATRR